MKPKTSTTLFASLLALITSSNPLSAQSAAPSSSDPVVELSPFVVNSKKDTGYQATTTLAGTRLDTPLKDLGASISVYTKDFLDDIGATNSSEFLIYATGMEAGGPGGNYSGSVGGNDIVGATVPTPDGLRENPQGTSRSRGMASPTFTRDLFISNIDIDTYNTERVTVIRGPNASLIGVSSPAGVTDTSLIKADVQRNRNKVAFRYGNNDSMRTTIDFNRVLIPNKLAVRLAGLESREEYNQRPAYEARERIFGALTYQPFASTTLRGNFESGRMQANRTIVILPMKSMSNEWFAAGRPGFDWTFYDDPARNPNAAFQNSQNFLPYYIGNAPSFGFGVYRIYNNPDDQLPSLIIRNGTPTTNAAVGNALKNNLFHPLLNKDVAVDASNYTATRNVYEFPVAAYWTGGNVMPDNQPGFIPPGLKFQGFVDYSAFDFRRRMIDETAIYKDNFHAFNVTLEQSAWENRVGIALAYDTQRQDRSSAASFVSSNSNNHFYIDTSVVGPDGLPNPNYGRPWTQVAAGYRWTHRDVDDETMRATAYLKYDFKDVSDSWGKWVGRHTLSGVFERYRRDWIQANPIDKIDGEIPRQVNPNINTRSYSTVVYLGPSIIGNNNPLKLNPIRIPKFGVGPIGNLTYFARQANETDPGGFQTSPVSVVQVLNAGSLTREVIESQAVNLQSNWVQDHIVTVAGWRRDTDYSATRSIRYLLNPDSSNANDPGQVVWGFNDFNFPRTPPRMMAAETKSYSVVARWPQKLFRLPAGTDLSVFFNDSQNFTPTAGRVDYLGNPLGPPRGKTKEYGLNISMFNDRLTLRFNRFETANVNLSYGTTYAGTAGIPRDAIIRWLVEENVNPQLVAMRQADIATLLKPLPANYLQLYNVVVTGTAPNILVTRSSTLPGSDATVDYVATGVEFDVIYNPTPNLRILANAAKQQTVKSNILPLQQAFNKLMKPVYATLADRANGTYPSGWTPGTPLPANVETFGQFIDRALNVVEATELASSGFPSAEQRPWRFNVVANYSFSRSSMLFGEKLNGFGLGGGLRWQDKFILGFPPVRQTSGIITFDRARPYYAETETNIDLFMSYQRKIWDNRIDWKVQLNLTNVFGTVNPIPVGVQPWGEVVHMRLPPENRWYLTNSFSF